MYRKASPSTSSGGPGASVLTQFPQETTPVSWGALALLTPDSHPDWASILPFKVLPCSSLEYSGQLVKWNIFLSVN